MKSVGQANCCKCYWNDNCCKGCNSSMGECDDYYPTCDETLDSAYIEEYEEAFSQRAEDYIGIVDEINGEAGGTY